MFYKKFNINELDIIISKTLEFLKNDTEILVNNFRGFYPLDNQKFLDFCPEIQKSLTESGFNPVRFNLYKTIKNGDSQVHIDTTAYNCRINIPILNCEDTHTVFYEAEPLKQVVQENKLPFILCNQETAIEVERFTLDSPTVLRTDVPHKVIMNDNKTPRISLTIRCIPDPVFFLEN